jgi:hypothetical protein
MWKNVKRLSEALGPPAVGEKSWYYSIDFHRPVEPWGTLMPKIERELRSFMSKPADGRTTLYPAENVEIDLMPAGATFETFFVMAGQIDLDSGGFILAELEQNLRHCVVDKTAKVAPYRSRYPEWWLVFVDHISLGLSAEELGVRSRDEVVRVDLERGGIVLPGVADGLERCPPS